MEYGFGQKELDRVESILQNDLIGIGVHCALLIDMAGNVIARCDDGNCPHDLYSLAALAAGNFGAVNAMAQMVGEDNFTLLFHKGKNESIHFAKVDDDFLLITIFGNDVSLGFLRLRVDEVTKKIKESLLYKTMMLQNLFDSEENG
ncbi:MAG: roadblock/LC7 domain-containing protein [Thermodesulfobacteriota bacterium]